MISILIDNARNEKWDLLYEDLRKIHNVNVNQYNNYIGWNNTQSQRIDRAIDFIEEMANISKSKIIFIDNLSNIADQVEQAKEADRFISDLYGRRFKQFN